MEALRVSRTGDHPGLPRPRRSGLGITDVNTRFGGAFPAPVYAAPARAHLPRADRADGRRRADRAPRGRVPRGDDVHPLLLAARARRAARADRARHRPRRSARCPADASCKARISGKWPRCSPTLRPLRPTSRRRRTDPPGTPTEPAAGSPPAAAPERSCARCGAAMAADQDWCLQCGAGAPGSLGTRGWRSTATILGAVAVLALGAAAAAYAALSKGASKAHVVTATVAQATAPSDEHSRNRRKRGGRPAERSRRASRAKPKRRSRWARSNRRRSRSRRPRPKASENEHHARPDYVGNHDQHLDEHHARQLLDRRLERDERRIAADGDPAGHQRGFDLQPLQLPGERVRRPQPGDRRRHLDRLDRRRSTRPRPRRWRRGS